MNKEKKYQTNVQRSELNAYCDVTEQYINLTHDTITAAKILPDGYRMTIINNDGKVLFDNVVSDIKQVKDHAGRPEIIAARRFGNGYAIRESQTVGIDYLYYAKRTSDTCYIRIAMPYVLNLSDTFKTDSVLIYFLLGLFFISIYFLLYTSDKFGSVMKTLKKFVSDVEIGNVDYTSVKFPDTDSGEIGTKIISLYKQLEDSKKQTFKEKDKNRQMKQELTNNIAHELKTPVSSIRGYLETVITSPNISEEKRDQFLEHAYTQTLRLTELIDDVTMLNKIEDASSLFEKEKIIITNVFNEVYQETYENLKLHNIVVINKLDNSIIIPGNHSLIHSIFRNLVDNSIKYAGDNITIQIECTSQNEQYVFLIYFDTGIGVEEQYLDKIFDRFVRIDEGRTRKTGGSGLGLAIVKHAVMFHGGTIKASQYAGGGLQFEFKMKKKYS